jgi:cholesterol oxidase
MGKPVLRFEERMAGYVAAASEAGDFDEAYEIGRRNGSSIQFETTIIHDDLPRLVEDPASPGRITGTVLAPMLCQGQLDVVEGTFVLLERQPEQVDTDWMCYRMLLRSRTDPPRSFLLEGHKVIRTGSILSAWKHTTTLYVTVQEGDEADSPSVALGVMHIGLPDTYRLLAHAQVLNVDEHEQVKYIAQFAAMFVRSIWPFYAGSLDELTRFPVQAAPSLGPSVSERVVDGADDVRLCDPAGIWHGRGEQVPDACSRLVRYRGGDKGPVLLASGFGMSATSLFTDGVRPGLGSYLADHGYDVWLFDYRAGIELPSAETQFTIDDVARLDWPRAVAEVIRITGASSVQAFGHCVGSVSLLMAMLAAEGEVGGRIRSAVCAQFTLHPTTSKFKVLEADLHVGNILEALRRRVLRPDTERTAGHVALDLALQAVPLPKGEECAAPLCRWINAIYGLTHRHAQLDDATHDALPSLFGAANIRALEHLGLMMQKGRAVDATGKDSYMQHPERLAEVPIHLVAGAHNYIFHPEGAEKTLAWLHEKCGSANHTLRLLPEYAHLDALIGRSVEAEVFEGIVDELDRYQRS